ncbi:MAG: hypothetical protein WB511_03800, partial [Nitrososphaeraceae archaeon]
MDIRARVFIACLVGSGLLALFCFVFDSVYFGLNADKIYSLKLGGNLTYHQDKLTLVIGNSRQNATRPLSIFGISNQDNWNIFSSLLSGESGRDISPIKILFNEHPSFLFRITTVPIIIHISVPDLETGRYHGWMYISGPENLVVPVTLFTDPK